MPNSSELREVAQHLAAQPPSAPVLVGFDGFIDEIIHLVASRSGPDSFTRMEKMQDYAQRIEDAAGLSANIEMVPVLTKLGGNGPIMANSLIGLGHAVTYAGAIGDRDVHPIFAEFAAACAEVVLLAEPAHTDALEFHDGKIMMGKMSSLSQVSWDRLIEKLPEAALDGWLADGRLIACVNWTMLPFMNSIFAGLSRRLAAVAHQTRVFVDLTDPKKRNPADIAEALELLRAMQQHASVVLGLNKNESHLVAEVLSIEGEDDLIYRAKAIRERLGLDLVVIHPADSAYVADAQGAWHVHGPYTPTPKLTTGAGDVFNSGFCHGLLGGLTPAQALIAGVCASGFYVRNSRSATASELTAFMNQWAELGAGEFPA